MEMMGEIERVNLDCSGEEENQEVGIKISINAEEYPGLSDFGIQADHFKEENISSATMGPIPLKTEVFNLAFGVNNGRNPFVPSHTFKNIKFTAVSVKTRDSIGAVLFLDCRLPLDGPEFWEFVRDNFRPSLVKLSIETVQIGLNEIKDKED
jgi:hypothetical protein